MICSFFAVPPHAQKVFIFCASLPKSWSLLLMPSMMVIGLPNFLVSKRTRMRCCSLLISPQAQISRGSPHIGQISAIVLKGVTQREVYKTFKTTLWNKAPTRLDCLRQGFRKSFFLTVKIEAENNGENSLLIGNAYYAIATLIDLHTMNNENLGATAEKAKMEWDTLVLSRRVLAS